MFLLNSRQGTFAAPSSFDLRHKGWEILSLTYDRFFAEFLNEKSLVPLGLLALSTCVGFRYESIIFILRGISWKLAQWNFPPKRNFLFFGIRH